VALATEPRRFGYRRIHALLHCGGKQVDVKPVHRLYREERLQCLTIVDDLTKEVVDIIVYHGISGRYVTRALDAAAHPFGLLIDYIGVPTGIRTPVATVKGSCPRPLDDGDAAETCQKWWSQSGSNR
jgi:hypothetical protein